MIGSRPRGPAPALAPLFFACALLPSPVAAQSLTLGAAADAALAAHPSLRAAGARVERAGAARRTARAAFLPSLVGASGLTRYEEPMVVAPLHGFDPRHPPDFDRTLIQSQLAMEMTLLDFGARRAQLRGAEAEKEGLELRRDATAQELLEMVVAAYTGVLAARATREAGLRQAEALASELDRARKRLQEGTAARVEVLRAEAALLDARAQLATAEARTGLAERALARLMGADPASLELRPLADLATRGDGDAAGPAGAGAASTDPRVEGARREVDAARARMNKERAGRLPTLRGSAGLLHFGSSAGGHVAEWQAGLRLSWPLFTGGARNAAIARAEAEVQVAEEELRLAELSVAASLDGAGVALAEAVARTEALRASVAQWEEVARIEMLALEAGSGVQQDYLRAEAALFQARAGYARARYDQILALVGQARAQGILDRAWMDARLETR